MRWLARLWRGAATLLPPILMALLAIFSWWVAREAMRSGGAAPGAEAPREVDYFLRDFNARTFDVQGRPVAVLAGQSMEHQPGVDTVRINAPSLRAVNADGVTTTARARVGLSNADVSNVHLQGDAVVERLAPGQPVLRLRSDFLNVYPNTQRVLSDRPSTLQRGDSVVSADGLVMDGLVGTIDMQGNVHGSVAPATRPPPP